jgi:hypothetical protein
MSGCSICGGHPEYSVNCLVSTRRVRPRAQKCSRSVLVCESCIQASHSTLALGILERLNEAYTAIAGRIHSRIEGVR